MPPPSPALRYQPATMYGSPMMMRTVSPVRTLRLSTVSPLRIVLLGNLHLDTPRPGLPRLPSRPGAVAGEADRELRAAVVTGGGGGGGAYSIRPTIPVTPGNSYTVGRQPEQPVRPQAAIPFFDATHLVLAKGGESVANNTATGAAGGLHAHGIGDTKYSGGTGATGAGIYGGGGGSSAGTGANGMMPRLIRAQLRLPAEAMAVPAGLRGSSAMARAVPYQAGAVVALLVFRLCTLTDGGNGANGKVVITYSLVTPSP